MDKWARTRRQKIIRDISFESGSPHNIYNPCYSSEESEYVKGDDVCSVTSSMINELMGNGDNQNIAKWNKHFDEKSHIFKNGGHRPDGVEELMLVEDYNLLRSCRSMSS